jgi:hypothetical protein
MIFTSIRRAKMALHRGGQVNLKKYIDFRIVLKRSIFNFPVAFEILIWIFYVTFYKYSYFLELHNLPRIPNNDFPYLQLCAFAICLTLGLVPYYRWAVPKLLQRKWYGWLLLLSVVYFIFVMPMYHQLLAKLFAMATEGMVVNAFFLPYLDHVYIDWNLIMTDSLAFLGIAFCQFSFRSEQLRHEIETDHLQLQLSQLKAQLQPHFLFNTLNSLYGMSLTGSKETPRFILLLSQMMQYVLYDCNNEKVTLKEELDFLQGYFEIEQKKFPLAKIQLEVPADLPDIEIPPLLYLPLVENSFKYGLHRLEDHVGVKAAITFNEKQLTFNIENECLPVNANEVKNNRGGIGLSNIKKRLSLYYPDRYQLEHGEKAGKYLVTLTIEL